MHNKYLHDLKYIEEIYAAEHMEHVDGEFAGLTSDGEVAETLLIFMIKSLTSKQKDVVCIILKNVLLHLNWNPVYYRF